MPYRYVPLLRTKAGEAIALQQLTSAAKARILPIFHLVANPTPKFAPRLIAAWGSLPIALDGAFNFGAKASTTDFISMFNGLRQGGVSVIPSIECDAAPQIITAVQSLMRRATPSLVVKATLRQLGHVANWVALQGWQQIDVDLVIVAGHVANYDSDEFESYVVHALQNRLPNSNSWRSITLASSAAPQDYSALPIGRSDVPRLDWQLWQQAHQQVGYHLDYGDYGIAHPNLTEPPGVAMVNASVSVRYAIDDHWIILRGNPQSGPRGQPMRDQYRRHARALRADPQFDKLAGCQGDSRVVQIATQPPTSTAPSGSRQTWVEIGVNRHLSLVADRLP
jgi:hypothetical protein